MSKRYYWLKLKEDFFESKRIKKMRKLAGGDTMTIIYLKMQLIAMKHDGVLKYTGIEPTMAEEIALDIDEEADNVQLTLAYLISCGLVEEYGDGDCFLPYSVENVGSEGTSAKRVREFRERQEALHCNKNVTERKRKEIEIDKDIEGDGGYLNNIQGNPPAPPITPLAVTAQTDLDAIIAEWNAQNCTRKIDKIPFGTRRYSNTMLCINNDLPNFLLTIRELDKQAWFAERSKRKDPLSYDWFSDPNNYIKVAEGNYKDLRQTQHEETQQERSMRILQEATE